MTITTVRPCDRDKLEPKVIPEPEPRVLPEPEPKVLLEPEPKVLPEPEPRVLPEPAVKPIAEPVTDLPVPVVPDVTVTEPKPVPEFKYGNFDLFNSFDNHLLPSMLLALKNKLLKNKLI